MTSFRSPADRAHHLIISKTIHGRSNFQNRDKTSNKYIRSISTEKKYRNCVKIFLEWCHKNRLLTQYVNSCLVADFLSFKANSCRQKTLDGYRQSLRLVYDLQVPYVLSKVATILEPRAYRDEQIKYLSSVANSQLSLSIRLASASGMRAIELDTLARTTDTKEDIRPWLPGRFSGREHWVSYVVKGKGGLRRNIKIPPEISDELEISRLSEPTRKTSRGINYLKRYKLIGGHTFSQQFSRLSIREFNWSAGAHGLRHRFAQNRLIELQKLGFAYCTALEILSQELGHFSTKNTMAYLR